MILPTKYVSLDKSLLGAGAVVLSILARPMTTTAIWEQVKQSPEVGTYVRFVLVLDFLYTVGAIDLAEGLITKREKP